MERNTRRKLTLAALAAFLGAAAAVVPAYSQSADMTQVERNRAQQGEIGFMQSPGKENWQTYFKRGEQSRSQGSYHAALRDYDRALVLNPNSYEVFLARAQTYEKLGMKKLVIENYDMAIAMHPRQEKVWIQRANFFLRQNKPAEAIRDLDEGLRYLPHNPNLRLARGQYYFDRRAYGQAIQDAQVAIDARQTLLPAHLLKADSLLQLNDFPAYEQSLSDILAFETKHYDIWLSRAQVRLRFNRQDLAKGDLEQVIKLNPKVSDAWFQHGKILLHESQANPQVCAQALSELKKACRMGEKEACYRKPPCKPPAPPKPAAPKPEAQPAGPTPAAPLTPVAPKTQPNTSRALPASVPSGPIIKP